MKRNLNHLTSWLLAAPIRLSVVICLVILLLALAVTLLPSARALADGQIGGGHSPSAFSTSLK